MSKRNKRKKLVFSNPFQPESPVWQLKWLCLQPMPCLFPSNYKERPSSGSTEEGLQWAVCTVLQDGSSRLRPACAHTVGSWSPGNGLDPGIVEFLALCLKNPSPQPLSMWLWRGLWSHREARACSPLCGSCSHLALWQQSTIYLSWHLAGDFGTLYLLVVMWRLNCHSGPWPNHHSVFGFVCSGVLDAALAFWASRHPLLGLFTLTVVTTGFERLFLLTMKENVETSWKIMFSPA